MSAEAWTEKLSPGVEAMERLFIVNREIFGYLMIHSTEDGRGWCVHQDKDNELGCSEGTVLDALLHQVLQHSDVTEQQLADLLFPPGRDNGDAA